MSDRVLIELDDGVADVRLNRPEKHNALDWEMFEAINAALDELAEMPELRAVVLFGEGPSFCSGLDMPSFAESDHEVGDVLDRVDEASGANFAQRLSRGWAELPVPVIGALHGACFGGGFQIALGPDIRIAAPDTKLSVLEIQFGLIPDMGITAELPGLVRADVARELTYTGRKIGAEEAKELGLVTRIAEDPRAEAAALAQEIAANSPDAVRSAKRLWREAWRGPVREGMTLEAELQRKLIELLQTPQAS